MRDLPCQRLRRDESWSVRSAKEKNVSPEHAAGSGTVTAGRGRSSTPDTALVPLWEEMVGLLDANGPTTK